MNNFLFLNNLLEKDETVTGTKTDDIISMVLAAHIQLGVLYELYENTIANNLAANPIKDYMYGSITPISVFNNLSESFKPYFAKRFTTTNDVFLYTVMRAGFYKTRKFNDGKTIGVTFDCHCDDDCVGGYYSNIISDETYKMIKIDNILAPCGKIDKHYEDSTQITFVIKKYSTDNGTITRLTDIYPGLPLDIEPDIDGLNEGDEVKGSDLIKRNFTVAIASLKSSIVLC